MQEALCFLSQTTDFDFVTMTLTFSLVYLKPCHGAVDIVRFKAIQREDNEVHGNNRVLLRSDYTGLILTVK